MTLSAQVTRRLGPLRLEVDLEVGAGEVTGVLGPNGAGKTSLLRILSGLMPPDAGRVALGAAILEDTERGLRLGAEARSVGVVFQDNLLFPHLSALDNVAFGLRARRVGRREARRAAADWLERVGLTDFARAKPGELSGGQSRRVALARALVTDPALLLLDEPLTALDVDARLAVRRELRRHLAEFAGPCLLVTHEPIEAIALADTLVILEDGQIVQRGPVADVARRPRSAWAARLVGLNLYRGTAAGTSVTIEAGHILAAGSAATGEVFAVVHPRAVALHRGRPEGSPRNVWEGTIDGLIDQQDRVRVHVDGTIPVVAEVTPSAVADLDLAAGGRVWVSVKASEIDLYPT